MKTRTLSIVFVLSVLIVGIITTPPSISMTMQQTQNQSRKNGASDYPQKRIRKPGYILNRARQVPSTIRQPGTQPLEISKLEPSGKCDTCHGGYDARVETVHNWRGSMMANATRDPLFWAALAVAEQDFYGAGDICIRCHSPSGWLAGYSKPTEGSGLAVNHSNGVDCDFCHKVTNPDNSEHTGVQNYPFIANDKQAHARGYYGSGMACMWGKKDMLGPYIDPIGDHQSLKSDFHRSGNFCGTCHDVANDVVGDLAHNNGIQKSADSIAASGSIDSPLTEKTAFNYFPYQYGIVERTFSEYKSGLLSSTLVSKYDSLPSDLKGGAVKAAYKNSLGAGTHGNYADGSDRYFSCQTCHMKPVNGTGSNKKETPARRDLPLHDMTGGNYWGADVLIYLDSLDRLRLGGGLTPVQMAALKDGRSRAMKQLSKAATLVWKNNDPATKTVKLINQTGHKLITGYPEGRRMWLNIKWYDPVNALIREDGKYDKLTVYIDGNTTRVDTILNLNDPNTKIYEAHHGMTQEWAAQLISLGYDPNLPVTYDRITGNVTATLGDLATDSGNTYDTFHFVLNNAVVKDNRIPPYGMDRETARIRNVLPVPESQYVLDNHTFRHWDEIDLNPPENAVYATIDLLYQTTSWEYIQFLYLANNEQNIFLKNEGRFLLEAWRNTGMAAPYTMASLIWNGRNHPNR